MVLFTKQVTISQMRTTHYGTQINITIHKLQGSNNIIQSIKNLAKMISAVQYIQKGTVYRIRNRKTNYYLTSGSEVLMSPLQRDKIAQLWLLQEVKPNNYEIISMQSGQVLSRKQTMTIEKGNWSACQFWKLERAELVKTQNYFWIASSQDETQYLFASSISPKISMKSFDRTLFASNWEIEQVDLDMDLAGCCVFKSDFSGYVIDVPEGSHKDGVNIIQYSYNGRGNQRWVLQKVIDSYVIRNLCSNMILCPNGKSLKAGTKIMQSQFTNKAEEKWVFEQEGGKQSNKFSIRSKSDINLYLGVGSGKQSANLQLVIQREKGIWLLEGSYSKLINNY